MARTKVIIDNDFGGDPDGLFQLAHHVLSPSVDVMGIVNSHVLPGDPNWPCEPNSIAKGLADAQQILDLTQSKFDVLPGLSEFEIDHGSLKTDSTLDFLVATIEQATSEIIYCCGGPMTQLARVIRAKAKNLEALRVIWIGGAEHNGKFPPGASSMEYNFAADPESVQICFDAREIDLWQVPRNSYRRAVVSISELRQNLAGGNQLQRHLMQTIEDVRLRTLTNGIDTGETYCMGDSPLVLLSALENPFEPSPSDSEWLEIGRPRVSLDGAYEPSGEGVGSRTRVFDRLDTRLMFADMFAKLGGANAAF